jgi:hypothetical protein
MPSACSREKALDERSWGGCGDYDMTADDQARSGAVTRPATAQQHDSGEGCSHHDKRNQPEPEEHRMPPVPPIRRKNPRPLRHPFESTQPPSSGLLSAGARLAPAIPRAFRDPPRTAHAIAA